MPQCQHVCHDGKFASLRQVQLTKCATGWEFPGDSRGMALVMEAIRRYLRGPEKLQHGEKYLIMVDHRVGAAGKFPPLKGRVLTFG